MRIAIIETDIPREKVAERFGRYGQIFTQWLSPSLPEAEFTAFAVHEGEALPELSDFDGYLLTGSRYGVYEQLPWMAKVIDHVRAAKDAAIPVGGICFGHQIMAKAYGGVVEKSKGGWVLGRDSYSPADDPSKQLAVFAIHQDQVVQPPEGIKVVHGSERVPYGRLEYDFPAFSVQYHPEFFPELFRNLMRALRGGVISEQQADAAMASMAGGADGVALAQDFAAFFRQYKQ